MKPRFTIKGLLLVTAYAALLCTTLLQYRRNVRLQNECSCWKTEHAVQKLARHQYAKWYYDQLFENYSIDERLKRANKDYVYRR